jgi:hypothetical protein
VTVYLNGDVIPVDSSRVGFLLFGPGYVGHTEIQGRQVPVPVEYRQEILVHEARHSDCTGGIDEAALDIARHASTSRMFTREFPRRQCGHLHVYCPRGPHAGLAACDEDPWGAYAIGAVFAAGAALSATTRTAHDVMIATAIDSLSRLLSDGDFLIRRERRLHSSSFFLELLEAWGYPDMGSTGLID